MTRFALALTVTLALAACATADEGWTNNGTERFDSAHTACENEAVYVPVAVRPSAYRACMAQRGWTREGQ